MATFYVIPARECVEQAVAEFLSRVLPGLPSDPAVTEALLSAIEFEANRAEDVYLVHREDLPGLGDVVSDLCAGFGATAGDRVVEIGPATQSRQAAVRRGTVLGRVSEHRPVR